MNRKMGMEKRSEKEPKQENLPYVIYITSIPISLNRYRNFHWAQKKAEVDRWQQLILMATGRYGPFHKNIIPRKTHMKIQVLRKRVQDLDNAWGSLKPMLDAMKRNGWIVDDRRSWLDIVAFEETSSRIEGTRISLWYDETPST